MEQRQLAMRRNIQHGGLLLLALHPHKVKAPEEQRMGWDTAGLHPSGIALSPLS